MKDSQRRAMFDKLNTRSRSVKVYDSGKGLDRWTVIVGSDAYGMSVDPYHPQGFGMHVGDVPDQVHVGNHLGKRVTPNTLNDRQKQFIIERMKGKQ
tara:strand:+ start:3889 stop:4176 length:288 start_codon:yes stop_codon:yes gene_type:complete